MAGTAESYGFFWDSENHDRVYKAESFEYWLKKFFSSGVFAGDLAVTVSDALKVKVGTGYCNIDGKVGYFSEETELAVSAGDTSLARIDNVVAERNATDRMISLKIVEGTPAATPAAPTRQWDTTIKQIVLAQISVSAGAVSISSSDIKDTRADDDLCGYSSAANDGFQTAIKTMQDSVAATETTISDFGDRLTTAETTVSEIDDRLTAAESDISNRQPLLKCVDVPYKTTSAATSYTVDLSSYIPTGYTTLCIYQIASSGFLQLFYPESVALNGATSVTVWSTEDAPSGHYIHLGLLCQLSV